MPDPSSARYGSFYGFYFAAAGVLLPYLGLFLDNAGFTPAQIGTTIALMSATKLVSPYLFAIWSDRARSREFALRVCIVAGVLSFAMFVVARGAITWVVLLVVFTTIWNGVLPQFEALTIQVLGARLHRYAHIRIWGSVGYMIAVALLGYWFDRFGLVHYREVNLLLLVGVLASAMCLPATSRRQPPATGLASVDNQLPPSSGDSISGVLRDRSVIWLLALGLLMYASHGAYYGFFSLQLSAVGFDKTAIGLLWALAVLCEIALFVWTPRLIRAYSIQVLMVSCFALTAGRWLLIAWLPEVWTLLIFAQSLHAVSFGLFHAVTISFMGQVFSEQFRTRGQALFSTIAFGVGGALGSFSSGLLWESGGGMLAFGAAATLAFIGLAIALVIAPKATKAAS